MSNLSEKSVSIESVAKEALKDEKALSELLEALKSKNEIKRYNSFQVLPLISEEQPEVLYPKWDFHVDMLNSDNAYWKLSAVRIIANPTRVDTENKFEKILNKCYNMLSDSVIVAAHITANS